MNVEVNGKKYRVEFQYRTRFGKRALLAHDAPYKAITICTIVMDDAPYNVVLGAAVCDNVDHFSRPEGRRRAFEKAMLSNSRLDPRLLLWFKERFPIKSVQPAKREPMSLEAKQLLIHEGEAIRRTRRAMREFNEGHRAYGSGS